MAKAWLGFDLIENAAQFVEVHRFNKMEVEAGLFAAPNVLICPKPGQGDALHRSLSFRLGDHVVAAAVRQTDIAQNHVELLRSENLQRAPSAIGHGDFVAEVTEKTGQGSSRVAVIFHEQNAQRLRRLARISRRHATATNALRQRVERDFERCSMTSATALRADRAIVKIDKVLGNRQAETETTKLTCDRGVTLFERLKKRTLASGFNPDPSIGNLEFKMVPLIVRLAYRDLSVESSEFD